ncbi:MAG: hypothetical protein ABW352_25640 [Polyangiales bacterium]
MARTEQSRVAQRGRVFALIVAAAFAGACGDDSGDGDKVEEDSGTPTDAARPDASRPDATVDAATDAGIDAGRDAGTDAGRDAGGVDAGPLAVAGEDPPTIAKVGFYDDALGLRILLAGSDKNGDIASYTISFFDMANVPVVVNLDGMDETQDTSLTDEITHDDAYADFFVKFTPSIELLSKVKKIKVTVTDKGGRSSAESEATLGAAPTVSGACDPNGFNRCGTANTFCAPQPNGNFSCQPLNTVRMNACTANNVLTLKPPATASVSGNLNSASYWDAPMGCVGGGGETMAFKDRVVKLVLDAPAKKVTLSTGQLGAQGGPTFDAVIYKLDMCNANPVACVDSACACGEYSLVLNDLPKGDHFIVVDSYPVAEATGDSFTLTATVEQ